MDAALPVLSKMTMSAQVEPQLDLTLVHFEEEESLRMQAKLLVSSPEVMKRKMDQKHVKMETLPTVTDVVQPALSKLIMPAGEEPLQLETHV